MTLKNFLLILISQFCILGTQVLFKRSVDKIPARELKTFADYFYLFGKILTEPFIGLGVLLFVAGMSVWLAALAQVPLNMAYCFESLQYIFIMLASGLILREKITSSRILGTCLISLGVLLAILA